MTFTKAFRIAVIFVVLLMSIITMGASSTPASAAITMKGADVSSLQRAEELGQKFFYRNGTQGDALDILKANGFNYIRLRIWVNPVSGYNNKAKILQYAQKVKSKGLKLMIDFHYSDSWADPGQQNKPAAWSSHNISQLQTDVYNHTFDVCNSLKAQGTTPDSVQVGNEINTGMLWPEGQVVNNNFTNLGLLLKSGYNAVKACNAGTQVIIHTADADSMANARWFYDGIRAQGVQWDLTGLSYYCYWHGTLSNMTSVVADMRSRYGKDVILAETAYAWTTANGDSTGNHGGTACSGYPISPEGQRDHFNAVLNAASSGGAIGVFYWEPTWVPTPGNGWDPYNISGTGSGWDSQTLFNFSGVANIAISQGGGGTIPTNTPTRAGATATRTNTPSGPTPTRTNTPSGNFPVPGTYYRLINRNSGKVADVSNRSTADGGNVLQWTSNGGTNQQWSFVSVGSGYYKIINRNSGKVLDVNARSTADGGDVIQWTDNGGYNQNWSLISLGSGYYRIVNRNSGKDLDVANCGTADGANIQQWAWLNNNCQQWQITP